MKENTTKDMDVYSKDSTVIERPESYAQGVKVGWTAPAKWWNWLFKNVTERLKDIFVTTTSIHNEIKNAVGGTLDPESDTQLKDKLEQMKKDLEDMTAQVSANLAALEATKAKPNGLASLDPDGRIPYSQLPESAMEFKGDWDASTNTPTLVDGTGDLGDMYLVSVGGTVDLGSGSITFLDGDRVIYNQAGKWEKISGGSVKSVNNATPDDTGNVNVVVDTDHIKDSAVTTGKIAQGAVTSGKIANGAVTEEDIANGAVTTGKIADRAVTAGSIADRAITTSKIADRTVTADKILDRAVTTGKIADSAVTTGKIAQGSIIEENIANGAITARKCKSGSNLYMHYLVVTIPSVTCFTVLINNSSTRYTFSALLTEIYSRYNSKGLVASGYAKNTNGTYTSVVLIRALSKKIVIEGISSTGTVTFADSTGVIEDSVMPIIA